MGAGILVLLFIAITMFSGNDGSNTAATGSSGQAAQLTVVLPNQAAFIQTVESYYQPYKDAPNELKGSALRTERKEALAKLMSNRTVTNWSGTLESLDTNSEGKAAISIKLDSSSVTVATWSNGLSDFGFDTLIANSSDLYNKISDMSEGDHVTFSGEFLESDKDYLSESSLTENGAMTTPTFIMKFSDVAKMP